MLKVDDIVTWGSGAPRARIEGFGAQGEVVLLELTRDLVGPCGRVFPKGMLLDMLQDDLRLIH